MGQHGRFPSKAGSIREHQKEQHFGAAANGPFNVETQMVPIIGLEKHVLTSAKVDNGFYHAPIVSNQQARAKRVLSGNSNHNFMRDSGSAPSIDASPGPPQL